MILQRVHGIFFMLLGGVSVVDGWRIAQQAREGANFDAIGPDRYLMALGALMLTGRCLAPARSTGAAHQAASRHRRTGTRGRHPSWC